MSKLIVRCLFFVVWFVNLDCQNNLIRPKIITQNGDIIIEAALNKNIVLRTNGPNSAVLVGDLNILQKTTSKSGDQYQSSNSNNFETYFSGPNSIIERLERLENQTAAFTFNTNLRPSTNINRKINRLLNLVNTLQRRIEEITSDECESNPCQKGGTCLNLANGYHCLCPSNWEGKNCDIDVNECRNFAGTDLGCQNGATCINRPGTYECFCAAGWYGLHCTRREKDCSQGNYEMCGHGTCIPSTSGKGFTCICDQGWETNGTGLECLTDVNECDARNGPRCSVNPKVECVNWPGSFRCGQCPTGYEGDGFTCSDINECLTIPNGGCSPLVTCHNTVGSRICGPCPQGYQGDGLTCTWRGSCNINHGGCHPSAQCVENMSTVQCVCPFGMDGDGIGTHGCYISTYGNISRRCDDNPCGNHGQCHQLMTGYTCLCFKGYSGAHCDIITDSCSSNPCRNGGTCRSENSISGFSCECPAQYTGHLCGMKVRTCGGYLDSEEGSIVHPLTNTSYSHNNKCAWVIHTLSNKVINVTFSKFDLEPEPECLYDFLQIHDGRTSSSQLIGRFCGSQLPNGGKIVSSHNYLYFWFRSDDSRAGSGFALHWNSIDPICGGEVNASTHGVISSPGSPGNYPPNRDCFWYLSTSPSKRISLAFFTLDIESHANCSFDYLTIYNGRQSSDPLINKYCNSTQPQPTTSTSSDVMIHFHSDSQGSGHGFQISYASIEGIPGCGGMYTLDRGEIISPSYNGRYLNNLRCEYKITTEADSKIRIDFKSFELESSHKCRYDYVKVYDGPSTESKLIGKFCGKGYPKHSILSSSNNLVIIFRTDHNINSGGFKIAFESICQKLLSGDSGVITSPGYPFSYPPNKVCEYIIGTVPGKAIQLTFQDFNLEDSRFYNCRYDYVEIRDGPDSNSTSIGKFCGAQHLPPTQLSTHNYLYMRFKSDISNPSSHLFNGFYANYTTIKTECGGIFKETTGSISHPSTGEKYKNSQHCNWFLIAPEGMSIQLTWNSFHLESSVQCRNDFLELVEVDSSNKQDSIGKYCGSRSPPSLTTTTSRLLIKFESDSSLMFSGFTVAYQFLDTSKSCGGIYVKTHGFIYSPGWPKRYPNNQDCTWTIHVPVGQQITLNISQFNIEQSHMNKCDLGDYLEVRNGITAVSPLIGKYCGSFTTKSITSMGNALYIRFYSDFYMAGNGFMIEWKSAATLCGGTLTSSSGSITSPNYPEKYNNNEECFYKIITSHGSRIKISFLVLELENTPSCRDDYVEIFDGIDDNSPSLGRHCYMSTPLDNLQTTSNVAFIKFRTDFYTSGKGFSLNYFTICQNNVTGTYGVIESPDYPGNYPTYSNCLWTINVPKGHTINITFSHFDVFADSPWRFALTRSFVSCLDYVQFKELNQLDFTKKYCGIEKPRIHHTNSNSLQIKFISGSYFTKSGFRLEWVSVGCGGKITKQFGSLNLEKNATTGGEMECLWIIEAPLGRKVTIEFKNVYMSDTHNCSMDAIEILNGPDINSPLISKFCSDFKDLHKFQSSSNYMLVRFVKRSDLKDGHFQSSFSTYEKGCGGTIRSHSGIIYSPNYPNNYDNDLDCVWTITVPKNHRIELNFIFFDLYALDYSRESCSDSIRVFDSKIVTTSNYTRIICANSHVSQIVSKSNNMALQFITDNSGTAKGFKANFTVTCGATIIATFDGLISNEKYVSLSNRSCTWTIKAPRLDQKITLTITHMSIPKTYTTNATNAACHPSFLRVLDGDDENAPLVNEYCGSYTPRIVSRGSALTVVLGTYSDRIEGQFTAHYSSVDNTCGGSLTSENGEVASPNYPSPYPPNSDCEWTLYTSPGNRVYMNFETFDLENSEDCNQDYVEIRENNDAGLLLGVYCGSDIPRNTTIASKLYVKFRSDGTGSSRGFMFRFGFLHGNDITGLQKGDVASPLYPYPFKKPGEYTWRITVPENKITLTISHLEIHTRGDTCTNSLVIYDGYDEDAPILENVCGVLRDNKKNIQSSFNVILIKLSLDESNMGALFYIRWAEAGVVEPDTTSEENHINCGSSVIQLVVPGNISYFSTPNYPNHYDDSSNCEWIYRTSNGRHLELDFLSFQLEERPRCYADSVSVYSSLVSTNWKPVKTQFCLKEESVGLNASKFMKINFASDSSVTAKGFQGRVTSVCGGVFNDLSGTVSPSWFDWKYSYGERTCDWVVRVRPGRQISLRFLSFNITSVNNQCSTYVVLRNGETLESPLLSSGKYCGYEHEVRDNIETTGNSLFVRFKTTGARTQNYKTFVLWYEEKNIECGGTSSLTNEHNWEIINSPNFPSVPIPYTECVWSFSGPPGRTLSIDFIDRFDIDSKSSDCSTEYVEVRDGSTELSPSLGRFCTEKPGTIKSKNNLLFVKYSTQISEPRNGFKANVSIDICGGTIIAVGGELSSPGYPHMAPTIPYGTVCTWHLIGKMGHTFMIKVQDINLPDPESPCATKVTIEEMIPENNTFSHLKTYCSELLLTPLNSVVQTLTNNVTIKLHFGKPSLYSQLSQVRGFRLTFNSSMPLCTEVLTAPQGILSTPSYPRLTTIRYCHWIIDTPDEGRRITLELKDFDPLRQRIGIYSANDRNSFATIQNIPGDDYLPSTKIYESTSNSLILYVWLDAVSGSTHRFQAEYNSDSPALCGGTISGSSGNLISPNLNRSYSCKWHYYTELPNINSTIVIKLQLNSSTSRIRCRRIDSRLSILYRSGQSKLQNIIKICGHADTVYRIPSNAFQIGATKKKRDSLYFSLDWNTHPCGGSILISESLIDILNIPSTFNDTLDCAWVISVPVGNRVELTLGGTFQFECEDEFLKIHPNDDEQLTIGDYCKDKTQDSPLLVSFSKLYVEYHSKPRNNSNIKLMGKLTQNQCGSLMTNEATFSSPNYPKQYPENIECAWEIKTDLAFRVSLKFIGRFAIEGGAGSCKDAVIIYDWKEDAYTEIARLCGRDPPRSYNSTFNRMKVVFRSNDQINLDGFQAQWTHTCGGDYNATEKEQFLYSPGFPNMYPPSMQCVYTIKSNSERSVYVKFIDFELEGVYPECENDNLTISAEGQYDFVHETYCGSNHPELLFYKTVTVTFRTDRYIARKGFKLSYWVTSCGGEIKEPTVISSGPIGTYDSNLNCTWKIEGPQDKNVVLTIINLDLESSYNCYNDYIAIYEGLVINDNKRLALLCGKHDNSSHMVIKSTNNTMLLNFISDFFINAGGFKVAISFSYSTAVGCGGNINLTSPTILKSPLIGSHVVYENYLDCVWLINAPENHVIKLNFNSFHVAPCQDVNQTALGINTCDCDYVQLRDGIQVHSMIINQYCGHTQPMEVVSSGNSLSVIFHTDGEVTSSGFEMNLNIEESVCGQSDFLMTNDMKHILSPNYQYGSVPRGLHCVYNLILNNEYEYYTTYIHINYLDLQSGTIANRCDRDNLVISKYENLPNSTLGTDYVINKDQSLFLENAYLFEQSDMVTVPSNIVLCGIKESLDIYVTGRVSLRLQTTPLSESDHRGFDIEIRKEKYCTRNFSEPYGRIKYGGYNELNQSCYTLITVPENYTVSAYFISTTPLTYDENVFIKMYDGNTTSSELLKTIDVNYDDIYTAFSTGRYMLIYAKTLTETGYSIGYDMTYVSSERYPGCGGKLVSEIGRITSPAYPDKFQQKATCVWELETPPETRLLLRFTTFDFMISACDQVYLQLFDRNGDTISEYCEDSPADYTSPDNYVKVVLYSSKNNGGQGFIANFVGIV